MNVYGSVGWCPGVCGPRGQRSVVHMHRGQGQLAGVLPAWAVGDCGPDVLKVLTQSLSHS